jgi:hypothetical protein
MTALPDATRGCSRISVSHTWAATMTKSRYIVWQTRYSKAASRPEIMEVQSSFAIPGQNSSMLHSILEYGSCLAMPTSCAALSLLTNAFHALAHAPRMRLERHINSVDVRLQGSGVYVGSTTEPLTNRMLRFLAQPCRRQGSIAWQANHELYLSTSLPHLFVPHAHQTRTAQTIRCVSTLAVEDTSSSWIRHFTPKVRI